MHRLAWAMLLCVSVDFSNPMLPGSVTFDPSASIEAVHAGSAASISAPSPAPAGSPDRRDPPPRAWILPPGAIAVARAGGRWLRAIRPARHVTDDLTVSFPAEDH